MMNFRRSLMVASVAVVLSTSPALASEPGTDIILKWQEYILELRNAAVTEHERLQALGIAELHSALRNTNLRLGELIDTLSQPKPDREKVVQALEGIAQALSDIVADAPGLISKRQEALASLPERAASFAKAGTELNSQVRRIEAAIPGLRKHLDEASEEGRPAAADDLDNALSALSGLKRAASRALALENIYQSIGITDASLEPTFSKIYWGLRRLHRNAVRIAALSRLDVAVASLLDDLHELDESDLLGLIDEADKRLQEIDQQINSSTSEYLGTPAY